MEIAKIIDSTLLRPDARPGDIERLCREAREYGFAGVCIPPYYISAAKKALEGSPVRVISVAGFPLGTGLPRAKITEVRKSLEAGAREIDMVINLAAVKAGDWEGAQAEMKWCVRQSRTATFKMILETCYLTREEKVRACECALSAGAHFVKTSTGFGPSGATVEDVALLASVAGGRMGVKASGGIGTLAALRSMVAAGATRIGTSHAGSIMKELGTGSFSMTHG